jgi:ABC-type amino acid transport substrate-binding protein
MKRFYLVLISFLVLSSVLYGQTKVVITATDLAPLCSASMKDTGLLPQIIAEALKEKNYSIEYFFQPMARVVTNIANKSIDVAFISRFLVDEKNYYIKSLLLSNVVFFYKKSKFPNGLQYTDLSELKKYHIGVVRGAPTIEMLEKAGLKLDLAADEFLDFNKLQADRLDLLSTVDVFGWYTIKKNGADINDYSVSKSMMLIDSAIIISKSMPNSKKIFDDIDTGYTTIKTNNKLLQILEIYFGKGKVQSYSIPK